MATDWDKLIKIVDRTADKVIFFSGDQSYVIMPLDQYEASLQQSPESGVLTEQELIDKINRDIAMWRAQTAVEHEQEVADSVAEEADEATDQDDDDFHIEPVNI